MEIVEYKRAVRCLGDVALSDQAVVIVRMKENGQIVSTNCGEKGARQKIYDIMAQIPVSANIVTTTKEVQA